MECSRSRETVKRSALAGWANYGYCRSHSRFYWGLKLLLVCTPAGLPVTWALADPKIAERQIMAALLDAEPHLAADRPGLLILADKGLHCHRTRPFSPRPRHQPATRLLPQPRHPTPREALLKAVRQLIESVNDTLKGQPDLEQHGGRTIEGVAVAQRIFAMTCAIWHNHNTGAPVTRSLTAYDH